MQRHQIGADNQSLGLLRQPGEKVPNVGNQFWGPSSDIDGVESNPFGIGQHRLHGCQRHNLVPMRPCLKMTMTAAEIAEQADIDLQGAGFFAHQF